MLYRIVTCLLVLSLPPAAYADEASVFDYWLGDHIIDYPLSELDVITTDLDSFEGQSFIRVRAPNSNEVVLTFRRPRNTLQYIEHDWINREVTSLTALDLPEVPEFIFGQTRIADIQSALGQQGFHYACRSLEQISGGMLSFISFEFSSRRDAVYTFVVEYSRDLANRGLVDLEEIDLTQAVLVGTIVSRPDYPEDFWCADRVPYTANPALPGAKTSVNESFESFLPLGTSVADTEPWEVITDPEVMIAKNGALTWGDRLFLIPNSSDCSGAAIFLWAHTYDDEKLLALEGRDIDAAFNLLLVEQKRVPLQSPVLLKHALYAPIKARSWPPFAIGSLSVGTFDLERLIELEKNQSAFGFSLEFSTDTAGMQDNYWSLEGLYEAGSEAMRLCQEHKP